MSYQERRYKRMIQQVLYGLKRQYSALIAAYKLEDAETDYTTGIKTITKLSEELKAVVVPTKINREVLQSISQISANKAMVYGGSFDSGTKTFVIDARDLSVGWEFTNDDWIVYNNQRFEIKNIERLDFHAGWIIVAKMVIGQHAEQIFHLTADSTLSLDHVAASVPWTYWAPEQTIGISQGVVSAGSIFNRSAISTVTPEGEIPQIEPIPPTPGLDLRDNVANIVERPRHPDSIIGINHSVSVQRIIYQNPHSEIPIHDHRQFIVGLQAGVESQFDLLHLAHHDGSAWMRSASSTIGINQEVNVQKSIFKNTENTIGIADGEAIGQKVINRSVTSVIATAQQLDLSVIRELTANSTIPLTSTGDRQAILNRQPSSDIGITQDFDKTKVMFDSASSDIGITDETCQLATDLVSAWYLDETSGTRVDSWGSNNLADVNGVGYASGVVGNAADLSDLTTQLRAANDATLQTGDIDFMFTGWVYLHNGPTTYNIWSKWHEGTNDREYLFRMKPSGQLGWGVSRNGIIRTEVTYTTVLSTFTWYFVCVYHDSVNNQIGISVNNGSFTTLAHTTGVFTSPSSFTMSGDHDVLSPFDGCIDAVHFWKRILSPGEITEMYNGGSGKQIPPFGP